MPLRHRRRQVRQDVECGVHEREVRERLRKVPEHAPCNGVVLLGDEAKVVRERGETLEQRVRLVVALEKLEAVDEPEGAREEHAFSGWQPVDTRLVRAVAQDEPVFDQASFDRVDGPTHPWVGRR